MTFNIFGNEFGKHWFVCINDFQYCQKVSKRRETSQKARIQIFDALMSTLQCPMTWHQKPLTVLCSFQRAFFMFDLMPSLPHFTKQFLKIYRLGLTNLVLMVFPAQLHMSCFGLSIQKKPNGAGFMQLQWVQRSAKLRPSSCRQLKPTSLTNSLESNIKMGFLVYVKDLKKKWTFFIACNMSPMPFMWECQKEVSSQSEEIQEKMALQRSHIVDIKEERVIKLLSH